MLYTGAMDSVVRRWRRRTQDDGEYFENEQSGGFEHEHWITSILDLPKNKHSMAPEGGFVTGCMDKCIRLYNADFQLIQTLRGHNGGVISLAWKDSGELVSGSWDGTARIWNVATAQCLQVLEGHENGVCVLCIPTGQIITGSTGEQQGNQIVNFKIRLWENGTEVKTLTDHQGALSQYGRTMMH